MTTISGTIRIGEAQATCAATAKRQRGSTWPFWGLMLALVVGLGVGGAVLAMVLKAEPVLGWGIGAVCGLVAYARLSRVFGVWRFRKTLTGTGIALDLPSRFEITPDTFVHEIGDVITHAKWSAVTEVFHDMGWWIFMVQSDPWLVPDRFFADVAEARAFLREALSHMSEAARARSGDAVKFVATAS
jgi:hypothetical protein